MITRDLLNGKELAARIGISAASFHAYRRRGAFNHLRSPRPLGQRRYVRVLVEQWLAGESTVPFGRRRAS